MNTYKDMTFCNNKKCAIKNYCDRSIERVPNNPLLIISISSFECLCPKNNFFIDRKLLQAGDDR